jgi:hypothetical protein
MEKRLKLPIYLQAQVLAPQRLRFNYIIFHDHAHAEF